MRYIQCLIIISITWTNDISPIKFGKKLKILFRFSSNFSLYICSNRIDLELNFKFKTINRVRASSSLSRFLLFRTTTIYSKNKVTGQVKNSLPITWNTNNTSPAARTQACKKQYSLRPWILFLFAYFTFANTHVGSLISLVWY